MTKESSKNQPPSSNEAPGFKPQNEGCWAAPQGLWNLVILWSLALGIWCFSTGCASSSASNSALGTHHSPLLYAVLSAYEPETKANELALLATNAPVAVTVINGVPFKRVSFEGHDLLLFPSGVSMVNAAMTTQLALDRFPVTHMLFAGVAGGINPAHHIGDVVVPEQWAHHSEAAYLNRKADGSGYVLPEYFKPPYENFGFMFPDHVWAVREG
ncbi:MAG TPA: hypothetical protein VMB21_15645, partial [Candidatus Limnocylindria bacterium]|nr:hypothetical protein [Candidatus Limnocylindria bacterium]